MVLGAAVNTWLSRYVHRKGDGGGAKWQVGDLAEAAGLARQTLQAWLAGETDADPENVARVAKALGVPAPDLTVTGAAETKATPEAGARRRSGDDLLTAGPTLGGSLPDEAQLAMVVAQIHATISHVIDHNELTSRAGCHALACGLIAMAGVLRFHGAEVAQLDELSYDLLKRSKGAPDERG